MSSPIAHSMHGAMLFAYVVTADGQIAQLRGHWANMRLSRDSALGWVLLESSSLQSPYLLIASSLIAFILAIVVAINVMTVLLR